MASPERRHQFIRDESLGGRKVEEKGGRLDSGGQHLGWISNITFTHERDSHSFFLLSFSFETGLLPLLSEGMKSICKLMVSV